MLYHVELNEKGKHIGFNKQVRASANLFALAGATNQAGKQENKFVKYNIFNKILLYDYICLFYYIRLYSCFEPVFF